MSVAVVANEELDNGRALIVSANRELEGNVKSCCSISRISSTAD
jgi:hypothetical protein